MCFFVETYNKKGFHRKKTNCSASRPESNTSDRTKFSANLNSSTGRSLRMPVLMGTCRKILKTMIASSPVCISFVSQLRFLVCRAAYSCRIARLCSRSINLHSKLINTNLAFFQFIQKLISQILSIFILAQ